MSHGHVKLKSVNPYEHPSIQPNYLSPDEDRREFRDAVRLTREIFAQKAFDAFNDKELQTGGEDNFLTLEILLVAGKHNVGNHATSPIHFPFILSKGTIFKQMMR